MVHSFRKKEESDIKEMKARTTKKMKRKIITRKMRRSTARIERILKSREADSIIIKRRRSIGLRKNHHRQERDGSQICSSL